MAEPGDLPHPASLVQRSDSDAMFRLLVSSVRDYAIFLLDPAGHVMTWNAGAQRFKGYLPHEIIGRHFSVFYMAEEVASGKCDFELEVAVREGRFEDEGWRVRKDGTRFWANVVITALNDDDGKLVGFAKVTRDLTDRKRNEDDRAARAAAEEANRTKDEFLATLGHELRNPLAPMVTALQLLKLRFNFDATKELQVIERQVQHMTTLVDDLLDVSRISKGKIELRRKPVDLRDVIARAIEIASPLYEQKRHQLNVEAPPSPVIVDGDAARLTQVFTNLFTNAAKYTSAGGRIDVVVAPTADQVEIAVRDNGDGIDAELLPRVFDMFVQAAQPGHGPGGLGLGLALVRSLVTLHGGTVTVASPGLGHGTTFTVMLPRIEAILPARPKLLHASLPAVQPRRVLLVDDNADARFLLGEILASNGHDVRTAGSGAEALALVATFPPEVAILDLGMPGMDGYELARRLRVTLSEPPRVIALSGFGTQKDRDRSAAEGFELHFVKPVDIRRLLSALAEP